MNRSQNKILISIRNRFSSNKLLRKYGYMQIRHPDLIRFNGESFSIKYLKQPLSLRPENEFLLRGLEKLSILVEHGLVTSAEYQPSTGLMLTIKGINLRITRYDELYILNEIFFEGCYNFLSNKNVTLVDIGMNVGIASLYFATKANVTNIYSFEPIVPTFEEAKDNFKLNEALATKIHPYNFGLASSDRSERWNFNPEMKGQIGVFFDPRKSLQEVPVELKKADDVLRSIVRKKEGEQLVLKIDCEGGEYEIIPVLDASGFLNQVDMICMEWHGTNIREIVHRLSGKFNIIETKSSSELGMLYAFRDYLAG